ncbi:MAG: hypothetical protein UT55_C0004G0018 [Candidatus Peregrinibacteria bacterium GW2011_GWE2_39_6]|nr:MAG: hypothetical protein UT36_C0004G0069 [Candidatus Peregrinibacteria bacterium GW2011_GWF2_39_17]KKR26654.1 MAG: hypothetical protein UT55_C0004G0018 [Candidatus Peregrinibacteria bacterium GW2011_GWE2_39_6]HCW32242.1 hypothetical protein [Candidatus Peregrinibacteria bacterium]
MHLSIFTKKLTDIEKDLLETYLKTKTPRLEKFLTEFDEDAVKLQVIAEKFINKNAYKVEMILEIPKIGNKPLCASEDSRDLQKAVDLAKDKLVEQIKKGMDLLHHQNQRAT